MPGWKTMERAKRKRKLTAREAPAMSKKPAQAMTPSPTAKDPFYKWTVEIEVHAKWVADGFELDDASAHDMLAHRLSHAYGHELRAKVLAAPDPKQIAAEQGRKTPGYKAITDDNGEVEARPDLDVEI